MVHWRALDPLDVQPDEWLSDVGKYNLWCSMGHLSVPTDKAGVEELEKALKKIVSQASCSGFVHDTR